MTVADDVITGVVSSLSSAATLNATDKIDGLAGKDTLKVDLQANFAGFTKDTGFLKNVEVVELSNASSIQRSFAAKNVSDVTEYAITGDTAGVDLTDLAAIPATVGISGQKTGASTLTFATDVTKGTADAMAVKFNAVGTAEVKSAAGTVTTAEAAVTVTANGVETVTVDATGKVIAAVAGTDTKALVITGAGDLKLTAIQAGIKTVDASNATGAVDISLANASDITTYAGSAGNDTIRAAAGDFTANAQISGGAGMDVLKVSTTGTVQFDMSGVETVELANTSALLFSASKTTGVEKIVVSKDASAAATFATLGASDLTVDLQQTNGSAHLSMDNSGTVVANVSVTSAATATQASAGNLTASKASAVTMNIAKFGNYTGVVDAAVATSATVNVDGQISGSAELKAAKATSVVIKDTNTATANTVKLTTAELTNLAVTSVGGLTVANSSSLSKVEALTVNTGKTFDSGTNTFNAINSITLDGAVSTSKVDLGALGSSTLGYGVNLNASGLKGGLTVGGIDTGAGNAVTLNVGGVTGNVSVAAANDTITVTQADSKDTGSVTVNAATVSGTLTLGGIQAKTVVVDAGSVLGNITVGTLTGDAITFNAAQALGTVAVGTMAVGKSLTYTGAELAANAATVDVAGSDIALFLKGGLQDDVFTVGGFAAAVTTAQKVTITGDLNLQTAAGTDSVIIDISAATGTGAIEINLSALAGVEKVTVTGPAVTQGAGNFTYSGVNGSDVLDLSALAIGHTTGQVKVNLFAADGDADQVIFGSAVAAGTVHKAFEISGFEAGSGSDVLSFKQGLITFMTDATTAGSAATGTAAFTEIAKGGFNNAVAIATATTGNGIFEITGTGDVAVGSGTVVSAAWSAIAGNATATFANAADTATAKLFILDDGTDSYLWMYKSADATASSADIQLIGVVKGVTDFAAGDITIVA